MTKRRAVIVTTRKSGMPVPAGDLAPVVEASNAGLIELPSAVSEIQGRHAAIQAAAVAARADRDAADAEATAAIEKASAKEVQSGPIENPAADHLAAAARQTRRAVEYQIHSKAARDLILPVQTAWLNAAPAIFNDLEQRWLKLLDEARPAAIALPKFDWSDVDAIHELPAPQADAFHRLSEQAQTMEDLARAAVALAVYVAHRTASKYHGDEDRALVEPSIFVIAGASRPSGKFTQWRFAPEGHAVERLVAACVGPAPETRRERMDRLEAEAEARQAEREERARAAKLVRAKVIW